MRGISAIMPSYINVDNLGIYSELPVDNFQVLNRATRKYEMGVTEQTAEIQNFDRIIYDGLRFPLIF